MSHEILAYPKLTAMLALNVMLSTNTYNTYAAILRKTMMSRVLPMTMSSSTRPA